MTKTKTLHGLPGDIIFCKKCVMSNQRPSTSPEFRKTTTNIKTSAFGDDGICDACRYYEIKKSIDWAHREKELRDLCDKYRRKDGRYDVIVPGSGGKDSIFVSHILTTKYQMNPLTVTWAPHMYTEIGWRNLQSWFRTGIDNILVTANPKVHGILTKLAFENLVNPFQPFILGQKITAPKLALKYDVQLIMSGENHAEAHNAIQETETSLMDPKHYTMNNGEPLFFGGVAFDDLPQYGISKNGLNLYIPPTKDEVEKAGIEVHFLSHFTNWSPQANFYYSKEYSDFESNPDGRSEGTYSKYASLDDKIDGLHYFTMFIKFGQGRAMNDACRDIRDELITREEGVALVKKYDGEFPEKYYKECLNYMGITHGRFMKVIDKARSPHLWKHENGNWILKHQVH